MEVEGEDHGCFGGLVCERNNLHEHHGLLDRLQSLCGADSI